MDEAQVREQCDRLDNQELFGLMVNRFFAAGQGEDVLAEAELMKNILGQRLGFPIYQTGYATFSEDRSSK